MSCQVSVVVPAFNAEQFISECIQSVLDQEYQDFELIIVDDGSKDSTCKIVEQFVSADSRVRLLHHEGRENHGVSRSRKLGVKSSQGEFIAFLDADDQYLPGKLSQQVTLMKSNSNIVLSHTGILYGESLDEATSSNIWTHRAKKLGKYVFNEREDFLQRNPVCLSTTMVRRSALLQLDLAYPQMFQLEDWVMCILLSTKGNFMALPQPLTFYRKHHSQFMASFSADPLVRNYGGLEMCLALLSRIESHEIREKIRGRIGVLLHSLAQSYSSRDLAADSESLFNQSSETVYWRQRAKKAENSWGQLMLKITRKISSRIRRFAKR